MKKSGKEECALTCIDELSAEDGWLNDPEVSRHQSECIKCHPPHNYMDHKCMVHDANCRSTRNSCYHPNNLLAKTSKRCDVEFKLILGAVLSPLGCATDILLNGLYDAAVCLNSAISIIVAFVGLPCYTEMYVTLPYPEIHWAGYKSQFHIHMGIWSLGDACWPPAVSTYNPLFMNGRISVPFWLPPGSLPGFSGRVLKNFDGDPGNPRSWTPKINYDIVVA